MAIVYLNGSFVPQEKATISIFDRGFLFGDGIYEVIPAHDGHLIAFEKHIHRLNDGLEKLLMPIPLSDQEWKSVIKQLLELNEKIQGVHSIYIQVTRGAEETRRHALPKDCKPTVVAFLTKAITQARQDLINGFSAITLEDTRRRDCSMKAINLLPNILLHDQAHRAGAAEAILLRDGNAVEGTSSNLFIVLDGKIITPPLNSFILGGVTRELVLQLAEQNRLPFSEENITESMLHSAHEIWVTGSSKEIYPIVKLNGKPVGDGMVGPIWHQMMDYYEQHKQSYKSA